MSWIRAVSLSLDVNLANLSLYLYQKGIAHRITEENGSQVVWVQQGEHVEAIREWVQRVASGEIQFDRAHREEAMESTQSPKPMPAWFIGLGRFPWTLILLSLSLLGAALVEWDSDLSIVHWLTFQDVFVVNRRPQLGDLSLTLSSGQYWRLITPIFLHFSLFHILFNGLWLWEFGRRLELFLGGRRFLGLVMFTALASNLLQYFWEGASLFGGMSGVLYGLLGYLWIRHRRHPHPLLDLPKGLIVFMLAWLVIAASGAVNLFIDGQVANAAHVGGLLSGIVAALVAGREADTMHKDSP